MIENIVVIAREVAVLFILMGVGALLRRLRLLTDAGVAGLVNLLVLFVTPCLIIDVFQRPFDPSALTQLGVAFAVAVTAHLVGIALACALVRPKADDTRRPLRLAAVFSNAGFMGIPVEQAILGDKGVFFGIVYVVVFNLFMWSWGYAVMRRGNGPAGAVKMFVNPGTIGLAIGLPLFFFSLRLPAVLAEPIHHLSNLNTPLAMVVIGYGLAGARFGRIVRERAVYVAGFLRLLGLPLVVVALLWLFKSHLDREMAIAVTIGASAPVAAMVAMFATKFKRDEDVSVGIASATTLLSIATMPPVIALAMTIF